jgi:DNA repair protein RecO (recombination protein O)
MHGSYKTEAVVLRSLRLGEADRVLHLYTPSRGRVGAVAKGVRRTRSRVGARLEPFSHVALVLHEGRGELHTVSGVDTVATHHEVREQPERARIAGACGEALLKMFAEGDPSPRVFAALCRLLEVLDGYAPAQGDVALDPLLLAFQLKLHGLAGFAPRLPGRHPVAAGRTGVAGGPAQGAAG